MARFVISLFGRFSYKKHEFPSGQNRQKKQSEAVRFYKFGAQNTLLKTAFSAILPTGL